MSSTGEQADPVDVSRLIRGEVDELGDAKKWKLPRWCGRRRSWPELKAGRRQKRS
jgi:hypothetical protein